MSIFRKIKSLITKVDFMGMTPTLKIEGNDSYKTPVGGLLNIILVILSILGIIYFGKELIIKQEPIVVVSQTQDQQVGPFMINNKKFNIFIGLEYPNFTYYQDTRVYTVNATVGRIEHTDNKTYESILPLEVTLCNEVYTKEDIMNLFGTAFDTNLFYCVKPNMAFIEGFWGSSIYTNMRISIHRCTNSTENNNPCLPEEVIDNYVNKGILSTYALNPFISYANLDDP